MPREVLILEVQGRGFRTVQSRFQRLERQASSLNKTLSFLRSSLVVFASLRILQGFVNLADSLTLIRNRIRTVTTSIIQLNQVQNALFNLSQRTRTSFEANANVFARFARATGTLGITYKDLLDITEGVNQAIQISGSTAQEARNALIQFSQGLASGALQGEELRSVSEQIPRLAEAIGREFGIAAGELIAFNRANPGVFVTERVIKALRNELPRLNKEFKNINVTIAQAFERLNNQLVVFIGNANNASGVSRLIARSLVFLGDNLDSIAAALLAIGGITVFNIIIDQVRHLGRHIKALIVLLVGPLFRALILIRRLMASIFAIASFSFLLSGFRALLGVVSTIITFVSSGGILGFFTGILLFLGKIVIAAGTVAGVWALWGDEIKKLIPTTEDVKASFSSLVDFVKVNALPALVAAFNFFRQDFEFIFERVVSIGKRLFNDLLNFIKKKIIDLLLVLDNQTVGTGLFSTLRIETSGLIKNIQSTLNNDVGPAVDTSFKELGDRFRKRFEEALKLDPNSKVLGFFKEFLGLGTKGGKDQLDQTIPVFGAESSIVRNQKELERLLGTIDPGIKNAQDLRKAVDTLTIAMGDNGISAEDAAKAYTTLIRNMVGVGGETAKYRATLEVLNFALKNNAISQDEFNQKLREARIAMLETQRSFSAGFERFFLKFADDATNVAKNVETILSTTFQSLEDQLVQLATTGEFSFQRIAQAASQVLIRTGIRQVLGSITEAFTPTPKPPKEKMSEDIIAAFDTGAGSAVLILQAGISAAFRAAATSTAIAIRQATQAGIGAVPPVSPDLFSDSSGPSFENDMNSLNETISKATEKGTEKGTSNIAPALSASLSTVVAGLGGLLSGDFSGNNLAQLGSAALFSGANSLLFAANGANFSVAGNSMSVPGGGIDNRLVAFRANDREEVIVRDKGTGSGGGVNLSMTVVTPDADSFRKNQSQILNDGFNSANRAARRFS